MRWGVCLRRNAGTLEVPDVDGSLKGSDGEEMKKIVYDYDKKKKNVKRYEVEVMTIMSRRLPGVDNTRKFIV